MKRTRYLLAAVPVGVLGLVGALWSVSRGGSVSGDHFSSPTWSGGSEEKWSESKKIEALHPDMRGPVRAILAELRAAGYPARLEYTWRSLETQQGILAAGHSTVSFSFHNNVDSAGRPAALAADIIHERHGWGTWRPSEAGGAAQAQAKADALFAALGPIAEKYKLHWGGRWQFRDLAHIQLRPSQELAIARAASLPILTA